jgi:general secretion pathway protein K
MLRTRPNTRRKERGAALIIVLLLVATLAFLLLSITSIVTGGVKRASSERARSELMWRAAAAEEIADQVLKSYAATKPAKMSREEGIFADQLELPFEEGEGAIAFFDATGCFNVNSLVNNGQEDPTESAKFVELMSLIGLGGGEAERLKNVLVDFLDTDIAPLPQGAEDNFYTALPTPFRTADRAVASVSELRAMDRVSRALYRRVRPYLCALPDSSPAKININMASANHAPLIAALLPPSAARPSVEDVRAALEARPPGGYTDPAAVPPELQAAGFAFVSNLIEARARLEVNDVTMEEVLLFEIKGADVELLARAFGDEL